MDALFQTATNGRGVPPVLTLAATLTALGHDCRDDCTHAGAFDVGVRFIRRPVCPIPGSTGCLIVIDFAGTDLPIADRLHLIRDVNRCARADHIRVLARSSSARRALTTSSGYQQGATVPANMSVRSPHHPLASNRSSI
jgi:hypothetical protein